jgi:PHD/YefM family antitoxin component YafN of YafNO toxin-antitoxin module
MSSERASTTRMRERGQMRNLSLFYLATYDVTAEMLTASLQTISATARKLIELIDESAAAESIAA